MNSQFEISLLSNVDIDAMNFSFDRLNYFDQSEDNKKLANIMKFDRQDGVFEYFATINEKTLFTRDNLFSEINELADNVDILFNLTKAKYGIANFETNSLFTDGYYGVVPSKNMVDKSLFLFLERDEKIFEYLNKYHFIFKRTNSVLLFNPCGQVIFN
jgi:hypothetical protein